MLTSAQHNLNTNAVLCGNEYTCDARNLCNHILVAPPCMQDEEYKNALIYVCSHEEEGSMGLIINRPAHNMTMATVLAQLGMHDKTLSVPVMSGGPKEKKRGFILHSDDFNHESTIKLANGISLTATLDIIEEMANGSGPSRAIFFLGYVSWNKGGLEHVIMHSNWLPIKCTEANLIFEKACLPSSWDDILEKTFDMEPCSYIRTGEMVH